MRIWPILCLALLAGCTQAVHGTAVAPPDASPSAARPSNLALVDAEATKEVLLATASAVEGVFSFDPANPDAQQQAVTKYLTGSARTEVEKLLGPVRQAGAQVSSKVNDVAVSELTENSARVLVMIDQTSARPGGQSTKGGAAVVAVGKREQGAWQYSEISVNPTLKSIPKSTGGGLVEARDKALTAAHTGIVTLLSIDGNDVSGSLDRQLTVLTEPLLTQMRGAMTTAAQTMREKRTTVTVAEDPMVAATAVTPDVVTGLALVKTTVTSADAPQPAERVMRMKFELAKQDNGWKFRGINNLVAS
ncbi:hypothetical protein [Kibdelosporangium phytohabitans]|uniref:SnoaL-like domain-containing protein n=1 Tax=Kibdelosporangium phytohabitans TaxID=860235 RepID=A0A0N9HYP5_9PSEU|nr:hypothetical protein [Kibdelosporangium phytohabitans]ALG10686.1 hypothetical protein AOZ06_30700 [Kibdelosporangium phytohabitans]MBE1461815.1 Mce-associated membrane protein [Kibdelosporangium phytohabitans]